MNIWENRNWGPMLLSEVRKAFDSDEFIYELKFDGIRALLFASKEIVIVQNRHLQNITYLYPELQNIKSIVSENVIFDGEIVSFENGVPSFSKLQERSHLKNKFKINYQSNVNPVVFICFDILYVNKNITDFGLLRRKKILKKYPDTDYFIKNKFFESNGISFFKEVKKMNLEGIVAKRKDSKYYINKRTLAWIKVKNLKWEIFYIGGYVESSKGVSLLLGEMIDNQLSYVGRVVISFKDSLYSYLIELKRKTSSTFMNYEQCAIYVEVNLRCYVEYMERTKNNHLRQPVFRGIAK